MADVFSKAKRSEVMSRIRSRGNKNTELAFVKLLRGQKITGWRRHRQLIVRYSGEEQVESIGRCVRVRPDFVFAQLKIAIFVDGCFWHSCPRHGVKPKENRQFWMQKLSVNRARDRRVDNALKINGWHIVRVWEHELREREVGLGRLKRKLHAFGLDAK